MITSAVKTLLWKLRDAYFCNERMAMPWRRAWKCACRHVKEGWHLTMTPREAAQEEYCVEFSEGRIN